MEEELPINEALSLYEGGIENTHPKIGGRDGKGGGGQKVYKE